MGNVKAMAAAAITLFYIFMCFTISLVGFYGAAIVTMYITEKLGLSRKGAAWDLALSWDMCSNVLVGGDEQIRVSDRLYYWSKQGCMVAKYMEKVVNAIFYYFDGPNHCQQSFNSNPICVNGLQTPRPFPTFTKRIVGDVCGC